MTAPSERGRCRPDDGWSAGGGRCFSIGPHGTLKNANNHTTIRKRRKGRPTLPWLRGGAPLGPRERRTSRRWAALIRRLGPVLTCVSPAVSRRRSREHARQSPLAHPLSPPTGPWAIKRMVTWFRPALPVECSFHLQFLQPFSAILNAFSSRLINWESLREFSLFKYKILVIEIGSRRE